MNVDGSFVQCRSFMNPAECQFLRPLAVYELPELTCPVSPFQVPHWPEMTTGRSRWKSMPKRCTSQRSERFVGGKGCWRLRERIWPFSSQCGADRREGQRWREPKWRASRYEDRRNRLETMTKGLQHLKNKIVSYEGQKNNEVARSDASRHSHEDLSPIAIAMA